MSRWRYVSRENFKHLTGDVSTALSQAGLKVHVRERVGFINGKPTVVVEIPKPGSPKKKKEFISTAQSILGGYCKEHPKCVAARINPYINVKALKS